MGYDNQLSAGGERNFKALRESRWVRGNNSKKQSTAEAAEAQRWRQTMNGLSKTEIKTSAHWAYTYLDRYNTDTHTGKHTHIHLLWLSSPKFHEQRGKRLFMKLQWGKNLLKNHTEREWNNERERGRKGTCIILAKKKNKTSKVAAKIAIYKMRRLCFVLYQCFSVFMILSYRL